MSFDPIADIAAVLAFLGMGAGWVWGFAKMKAALDTNTLATTKATAGLETVTAELSSFGQRLSRLEGLFRAWTGL